MDAFNRYHKCFNKYIRTLLQLIGHDLFLPKWVPGLHAFTTYALLVVFTIACVYTIFYYEPFVVLNVCLFLCLAFEFSVKIYSVKYSDEMTWMINYLYGIYKINATTKCRQRASLFNRFAFYTEIIFKFGICLYFLSVISYFLYPIYMYLYEGEIVPLAPTYLPGVDEKTVGGFLILTCYHVVILILGFVAASACDFMFSMLIANTPLMALLIQLEVEKLNDALTSKKVDQLLVKSKLRNILLMHREMTEFVRTMDKTFFEICFAQIVGAASGSCIGVFVVLLFDGFYFPVIMLESGFFFQIASFCALGTIIEIANDRAYNSILECKWYLLNRKEQQLFAILMHNCQKPRRLSVGGFIPLNMVTCVNIFKTIYSLAMLAYTFLIE